MMMRLKEKRAVFKTISSNFQNIGATWMFIEKVCEIVPFIADPPELGGWRVKGDARGPYRLREFELFGRRRGFALVLGRRCLLSRHLLGRFA
jgi:hypothetical protein